MRKSILIALLSTVALPAMAADMPLKAPRPVEAIYNDWSGIYTGVAAGYSWSREKLTSDVTSFDFGGSSSLFTTGVGRVFNGNAAILQPAFTLNDCLIGNCNTSKMNGFMAGGFAGAQKQLGNWVIGIEGSWDFLGAKKSFGATEDHLENVTRFQPTTTFTVPGQDINVLGQTTNLTGIVVVAVDANGNQINTAPGSVIPAGSLVFLQAATPDSATSVQQISITDRAVTVGPNGFTTVPQPTVTVPGQVVSTQPRDITIGLPRATTVRALVTRSADLETKVDQIADLRGKIGLTNVFFGPNVLLYATGGAAIGHFNKSLSISQTTALCATQTGACVTTGQASRTDTFSATSGDTRLGWVVGAGIDWKLGPNFVLGALYRHHEFPKGTVSFSEGTNSLGFGTSRVTADSIQGRLSWLFPIQ